MTEEQQKHLALKAALLLVVLEGWTHPDVITARLGADAAHALRWMWNNGWLSRGEQGHLRWDHSRQYEELWQQLMPHRPCPVKLCAGPRAAQAQELR